MSIVKNKNGRQVPISQEDLALIINMLEGTLKNCSKYLSSLKDKADMQWKYVDFNQDPKGNIRLEAAEKYKMAAKGIKEKYIALYQSNKQYSLETLLKNEISDIHKEIFDARGNKDEYAKALIKHAQYQYDNEYLFNFVKDPDSDNDSDSSYYDTFTDNNFNELIKNFDFSQKPFDGIKDIADFDPLKDTITSLSDKRKNNSGTLSMERDEKKRAETEKYLEKQLKLYEKNKDSERFSETKERLDKLKYGFYAFDSATEIAKEQSVKLKDKNEVTANDLFEAFSRINKVVRLGQGKGGKIRGHQVMFSFILGVVPGSIALYLYKTLDIIAEKMNAIKKETDPDLRKTHAVELAAFTYQMAITEHVFEDGNGRSCRLFADTILQTFGLPPHIPDRGEMNLSKGFGRSLDFKKGSELIYNGVKKSSVQVIKDKENLKALQEKTRIEDAARKKVNNELKDVQEIISDSYIKVLEENSKYAHKIRGKYKNSAEYNLFEALLNTKYELAKSINNAQNENSKSVNLENLSEQTRKLLVNAKIVGSSQGKLTIKTAGLKDCIIMLSSLDNAIEEAGRQYIRYKYKDHTDDKEIEPGKKALTSSDKKKLEFIERILPAGKAKEFKENCIKEWQQKAGTTLGSVTQGSTYISV